MSVATSTCAAACAQPGISCGFIDVQETYITITGDGLYRHLFTCHDTVESSLLGGGDCTRNIFNSPKGPTPQPSCPAKKNGSIINVDLGVAGEKIPLYGTPFSLFYMS